MSRALCVFLLFRVEAHVPWHAWIAAYTTPPPSPTSQGSEDGNVHVWDIVEAKVTRLLKHHKRPVCSMSYHPSEPMLLTASYDGSSVLWAPQG